MLERERRSCMDAVYMPSAVLEDFIRNVLSALRVSEPVAEITARVLVDADLEGIGTHGVSRLPVYAKALARGRIAAQPHVEVQVTGPSTAVVDGGNGLGQWVAYRAMQTAVDLSEASGVGVVTVKRSNHFGAASFFAKMAVPRQKIGIVMTNTPSGIPPWGGKTPFFGTNPLAVAVPAGENPPVVVDLSTSVVARGNIIRAAQLGEKIPLGWAIDEQGRETDDPALALKGAVLPMGGPKGYALALAIEILSGVLTGAAWGPHVGWIYDERVEPADVGHFMVVIDIGRFIDYPVFLARTGEMIEAIKRSELAGEAREILLPGERRFRMAQERKRTGIPVPEQIVAELSQLAEQYQVQLNGGT